VSDQHGVVPRLVALPPTDAQTSQETVSASRPDMRARRLVTRVLACALVVALFWPAQPQLLRLRSGATVPIVRVTEMQQLQGARFLEVRFTTQVALADTASLRKQALEVWLQLAPVAEDRGLRAARLVVQAPATGPCVRGIGICAFRRRALELRQTADGLWYFADDSAALSR